MTQPPQGPQQPDPRDPYRQQANGPYPPGQHGPPPGGYPPPYQPGQPKKKAKKWPWIVLAVVVILGIIAIASGGGSDEKRADTTAPTASASAPIAVAPTSQDTAQPTTIPPLVAAPNNGPSKTIIYEVISDSDTLGNVTWFDENSAIKQDTSVSAPWSLTVTNNSTFVIAGLGAQTEGTSVTCRITVDGKVADEQTATGQYAVVNCTAPN